MQSHTEFFEALFKRNISSPDSKLFLQQMADKYPFFAPAQFYLLGQTKNEEEKYAHQAAKTAILFNNSFWLNFQLEQSLKADSSKHQPEPVSIKEEIVSEPESTNTEPVVFRPLYTLYTREETTPGSDVEPQHKEPLVFQPLYTTDYFASQGIKLSEEVQATDKLGVQLKSFTEWLRTMKKVHTERLIQPDQDHHTDEKIQTLAERSNDDHDVATEAMAEVLIQQGLKQKAMEVYEKLSLLNPAKSVYFAAKIEQLKAH